jgi:hypothetical protein
MRKFTLAFLLAALAFTKTHAAKIQGFIKEEHGSPLAYATVTVKGTPSGTTANSKGFYALDLKPGNYTLQFEYIGFVTVEKIIEVADKDRELNVILVTNQNLMGEVTVKAKGEDPAYRIIRQAIKKRTYYQRQTDSLSVDIYLKGIIRTLSIPGKFFGQKIERDGSDGLDSAGKGVLMLSESNLLLDEVQPNQSKITVRSSFSRGDNMGLNFSKVTSFYTNNVNIFDVNSSSRGFISPIADGALNFYKYKLLNTYTREGVTIKTIKVIPKRKHEPLFSGNIEIAEGSWRIYSLDLLLTKDYQLELIDSLKIKQLHGPVTPGIWKTKNQIISIGFNMFNFKGVGSFVNVYSNYNLHPHFSPGYFDNIVMKYDTGYYKKDSSFWTQSRPVALEDDEKRYYTFRDSMNTVRGNRPQSYYDSLRRHQKITLTRILWSNQPYRWYSNRSTATYQLKGLIKGVEYNSVEGVALKVNQHFNYMPNKGNYNYHVFWNMRYGFENRHFNSFGTFTIMAKEYAYRNRYLSLSGGKRVSQLNNDNPIDPLTNSLYTLFARRNYIKLYENWFGNILYHNRFENGFKLNVGISFEDRIPLNNTYSFGKSKRPFTPNHPEELAAVSFNRHQALLADITVSYQPGQKYIQYPGRKVSVGSDKPVFTLNYTAGIPDLLGSDVNYNKWKASVTDNVNLKLAGLFKYNMGVGGFLNADSYSIPDMKHFNGNRTFYNIKYLNSFQLAPYYAYSNVAKLYGEANIEHHFNGLLTNKVPLFNKLKWNLVAGGNAFYVTQDQYYTEGFVGLENILKMFRVDFIAGYQPLLKTQLGVRIGFGGFLGSAFKID